MKKIVLISCVSQKLTKKAQAKDLYQSTLFKKSLAYAQMLNPDAIYILSAEHHLLALETEIEPYDKTLNKMKKSDRTAWGNTVIEQLKKVADLENDEFTILAGMKYLEPIQNHLTNIQNPLKGMGIGKRLGYLNNQLNKVSV